MNFLGSIVVCFLCTSVFVGLGPTACIDFLNTINNFPTVQVDAYKFASLAKVEYFGNWKPTNLVVQVVGN